MSVAKGFRLSDDSTASLDWNYVTKPDGSKSIIEEVNDVKEDLAEFKYGGAGVTDEARYALLACLEKVAWIGDDGQDYYNALASALFHVAELTSISAVYTQSGNVYFDDNLNVLKPDLVVTAHYDDSSSQVVTNYTLSGILEAGTSTITVSVGGKTTTFDVVVKGVPSTYQAYDFIRMKAQQTNTTVDSRIYLKTYDNLNILSTEFEFKSITGYANGAAIWGIRSEGGYVNSYGFYTGTGTGGQTNRVGYQLHGVQSNPSPTFTPGNRTIVKYNNTPASPSTLGIDDNTPVSITWANNNVLNLAPSLFSNPVPDVAMTLVKAAEIGYIKFFDLSGELISYYVPVVRTADNVMGMFDIVEQEFYNSATASYSTIGNASCYYEVGDWS